MVFAALVFYLLLYVLCVFCIDSAVLALSSAVACLSTINQLVDPCTPVVHV